MVWSGVSEVCRLRRNIDVLSGLRCMCVDVEVGLSGDTGPSYQGMAKGTRVDAVSSCSDYWHDGSYEAETFIVAL